ncbi:MAG: site-specific integrase, partial [Cyclobacteriaceae bacterium]|nr:site-specific integrase [Cyclobacteriaceae bacterium]
DLAVVDPNDFKHLTIVEAFQLVLQKKKDTVRPETYKQYKTTIPKLQKWVKKKSLEKLKIGKLTKGMLHDFLDNLFTSDNISSNKTYNNYLGIIRAVLNYIISRDHKIFSRNPAADINMLHTSTKKHAAYSNEQMTSLKHEMIKQGDFQLVLFMHFIYYTLARPNEIKSLKIADIEVENDQIYISRKASKNRKSDYVDIYPPLKQAILESKIMEYPKEYFVFSSLQIPGPNKSYRKYFYRKHIKILNALELSDSNREYTLYSYKHSGAINLYLSGLEPIDIQKQCRHQTLQQTMDYLRELDLFRKKDHFNKVKSF